MSNVSSVSLDYWKWYPNTRPPSDGDYLCTVSKLQTDSEGVKDTRYVWSYEYQRGQWIDVDYDKFRVVAWMHQPNACKDNLCWLDDDPQVEREREREDKIVISPDSPMREIPITNTPIVERDLTDLRNELDAYCQARTRLITQAETMRDGIIGGMSRKVELDRVNARIHALQIRIRDLQAKDVTETSNPIFAGPQFNPNELASMTIGEFIRILKEIK